MQAVNELLARIYSFRNDPNGRVALQHFTLHEGFNFTTADRDPPRCPVLAQEVGRGNVTPLSNRPELADEIDAEAFEAKKTILRDRNRRGDAPDGSCRPRQGRAG